MLVSMGAAVSRRRERQKNPGHWVLVCPLPENLQSHYPVNIYGASTYPSALLGVEKTVVKRDTVPALTELPLHRETN